MINEFKEGREFEGLVRQIKSIYEQIDLAEDQEAIRRAYKHVLDEIFPRFRDLAERYRNRGVDPSESKEITQLWSCCIDGKYHREYKQAQEVRRMQIDQDG